MNDQADNVVRIPQRATSEAPVHTPPHGPLFDDIFWLFGALEERLAALNDEEFNHVYLWARGAWQDAGSPNDGDLSRFIDLLEAQEGRWTDADPCDGGRAA